MLNVLAFSCPLLLAATGALFSEYTGSLALFLDGFITLSGFLTFAFTAATGSVVLGIILSCVTITAAGLLFAFIVEKTKANKFIAAIAMNLLAGALTSLFSSLIFKTRGVLVSPSFSFAPKNVSIFAIIITAVLVAAAIVYLKKTQSGIYFRITGTNAQELKVRGVSPELYRILSWGIASLFAGLAGSIMAMKVSSFVPNLASGKGWLALAVVFMGRKSLWKIALCILIFCGIDFAAVYIQSIFPAIPSSVVLALPYIMVLLLIGIRDIFFDFFKIKFD